MPAIGENANNGLGKKVINNLGQNNNTYLGQKGQHQPQSKEVKASTLTMGFIIIHWLHRSLV